MLLHPAPHSQLSPLSGASPHARLTLIALVTSLPPDEDDETRDCSAPALRRRPTRFGGVSPPFDRARRHATCDERCAVQDRQLRPATSGTVSARTWCAPCRVQRSHTFIHHRAACLFVCAVRSDSAQSPCSAWFPIVCSHATLSGRQKQRPECSELHEAVPQAPGGQGRACSRGRCVLSKSQDDDDVVVPPLGKGAES